MACSVWELTAGGGARLCQSSFPQKSGHCTSERHLFVPAKCALCAGSLSGGHDLGFGWEVLLNLLPFRKHPGGMLREENSKEVSNAGFLRKVALMFSVLNMYAKL